MLKGYLVLIMALLWVPPATAQATATTSPLEFITEYIRQLGVNENMQARAEKDMEDASNLAEADTDKTAAMIGSSTDSILALNAEIAALKQMKLEARFASVPETVATFYQQKIDIHKQIIDIGTAFVSGPKPNVDYNAMAAEVPQLTAMIEDIDRSLFQATPAIFAMLIADKPDGQMSRLGITRAERDTLLHILQFGFGAKMNITDQDYIVGSASMLRDYLSEQSYKCSDE